MNFAALPAAPVGDGTLDADVAAALGKGKGKGKGAGAAPGAAGVGGGLLGGLGRFFGGGAQPEPPVAPGGPAPPQAAAAALPQTFEELVAAGRGAVMDEALQAVAESIGETPEQIAPRLAQAWEEAEAAEAARAEAAAEEEPDIDG